MDNQLLTLLMLVTITLCLGFSVLIDYFIFKRWEKKNMILLKLEMHEEMLQEVVTEVASIENEILELQDEVF